MKCANCKRVIAEDDVGGWNLLDEPVCVPCAEELCALRAVMPREESDHED